MITYKEALGHIQRLARPLPTEFISIKDCVGRVATSDVLGSEYVPSFDNSAMDGFVVNAAATRTASDTSPLRLPVIKCISAGDGVFDHLGEPTVAAEIMTGAPVPSGHFDAVIKIEDVQIERDSRGQAKAILIRRPITPGTNIRCRGEDYCPGQPIVAASTVLMPEHVMALASLGVDSVSVYRRPKIAVISTGREIVDRLLLDLPSQALVPGTIRNSTAPFLLSALPLLGAQCKYYGVVPDDSGYFTDLLSGIFRDQPDVVITTGAVSMGKHDFLVQALEEMNATIHYHKVAIRPGKPGVLASWNNDASRPAIFGMPGNPIATAVGLRFFIDPYIRAIQNRPQEVHFRARLAREVKKPGGLRCFFKGHFESTESGLQVVALEGQASFMVSSMVAANSWIVLPEDGERVSEGTIVDTYPMYPQQIRGSRD